MNNKRPYFLENKFLLDIKLNSNKMGSIKGKLFDLVLYNVYNVHTVNIFESNTRFFFFFLSQLYENVF